jgi:hypothetical protein
MQAMTGTRAQMEGAVEHGQSTTTPRFLRFLSLLSIAALPFSAAFTFHPWAPPNLVMMAGTVLVTLLFATPRLRWNLDPEDWLLIVAMLLGYAGLLFAPGYGAKTGNHALAILTCVGLYYILAKRNIYGCLSWRTLVNAIALMTFGSALFIIVEFFLANFADVLISSYVPYYLDAPNVESERAVSMVMGLWIRPRGLAAEAGHMAAIFELGLPLTMLAFTGAKRLFRVILFSVSVAGFVLLSSAAAITALLSSALFVAVRRGSASTVRWIIALVLLLGAIVVTTNENVQLYADRLVLDKTLGMVGLEEEEDVSARDRSQRVRVALDLAAEFPFGFGWGTAAHLTTQGSPLMQDIPGGFISLPAEFLVAGGWLALISLGLFFFLRASRLTSVKTVDSEMLLLGLCSLSIHYLTMSNYWFPVLWASLGLPSVYRAHLGERKGS